MNLVWQIFACVVFVLIGNNEGAARIPRWRERSPKPFSSLKNLSFFFISHSAEWFADRNWTYDPVIIKITVCNAFNILDRIGCFNFWIFCTVIHRFYYTVIFLNYAARASPSIAHVKRLMPFSITFSRHLISEGQKLSSISCLTLSIPLKLSPFVR